MKKLILLFVLFATTIYAQKTPVVHHYLDQYLETVEDKSDATYYTTLITNADKNVETIFWLDDKIYQKQELVNNQPHGITEYFYKSGKLQREEIYINGVKEGCSKEFYENDSVKSRICFQKGVVAGRLKKYWPNGKLKRLEDHIDGKLAKGICYDISGKEIPFEPELKAPEFPGGTEKFYKYLSNNFSRRNIVRGGKIVASAWVAPDGSLKSIRIIRGIDKMVDAQYADLLKKAPKWTPATSDGEYFPMKIQLPFTITME